MTHTRLWIAAAIIALVIIIGFILSVPHTRDASKAGNLNQSGDASLVTIHDSFKKGAHTITGSLSVPDACTTVTVRAVTIGDASTTEGIRIIVSMTKDTDVCLQLPTSESFSTNIVAPAHLPFSAIVNGEEATTTVL